MTEILEQLRADLMAAVYQYQQLFKEHPMPDIAVRLGYKNANVAKSALYDCRQQLNTFLAAHPELLDELLEP